MNVKYYPRKKMFEVYRKTDKGKQHFGYYHTEEAANKIVILLEKIGYDYNNLSDGAKKFFKNKGLNEFPIIKPKKRRCRTGKYYYYHKTSGRYIVQKAVDGKIVVFAIFKKESEAQEYVEFLKKHDWDTKYIQTKHNDSKHYTFTNGKYKVSKYINGKYVQFGRYDTEIEAKLAVDYFTKHNWDPKLKQINSPKYYTVCNGSYVISKNINGERIYFCTVYSEEDAKFVVNELIKINWDKNKVPEKIKKFMGQRKPRTGLNYTYNSERDLYYIQKTSPQRQFIGYVKTEEDALKIIDELEEVGRDRNKLSDESKKLLLNKFRDEPKYYSINPNGKFTITKVINGVYKFFGNYDTQEEAEYMVELLKQNNWDRTKLPREFKKYSNKNYYLRKDINKYVINKSLNGVQKYFGAYDTEEEAQKMVKELDKVNWVIEDLPKQFKLNKHERKNAKYYQYVEHLDKWKISKNVNGKNTHFGYYDTEKDAQKMVQFLKENNWDKSLLDIGNFKYYQKYKDKFHIKKRINGKMEYFGAYDSEEQVKDAIELLKQNNWDKKCLI